MRDYNEQPIIIEDYNSAFQWYVFKYTGIPTIIAVAFLYPLISGNDINSSFVSTFIITLPLYNMYKRSKQRRIVLSQDKIEYIDDNDKLSLIDMGTPNNFKKSFQNYYHKSQDICFLYFIVLFFLVSFVMGSFINGLLLLIGAFIAFFLFTLVTKYILSERGFLLFSSILVQQGDNIVSIPLYKANDYKEVEEYLNQHQVDYETLPVFFKAFYGIEEAFRGFNIFSSGNNDEIVCDDCRNTISKGKFSCPHCGNPQSETKVIETKNDDKNYSIMAILKDRNDFSNIKELVLKQYEPLGYTKLVIDKENSFMLNDEPKTESYVYVKLKDFELTIETFNTEIPTIKDDAFELFR